MVFKKLVLERSMIENNPSEIDYVRKELARNCLEYHGPMAQHADAEIL